MILALVVKATVVLAIALIVVRLARHARASVRHAILAAALATIAVLPIVTLAMPRVDVPLLPARAAELSIAIQQTAARPEGQAPQAADPAAPPGFSRGSTARGAAADFNAGRVLTVLWAIGATALLLALIVGIVRVQRLRRNALPYLHARPLLTALTTDAAVRTPVDLVMHEAIAAPITCGAWRMSIVLPGDAHEWSDASLTRALVHELEHVRRRDWATQVAARAICAVYWFHPLVWMVYRQLCLEAEHACDDAVVAREESTMYADQLVNLARRMASQPAVAMLGMAHRSDLSARVTAVLDATKARGRVGAMRIAAVAATAVAGLLVLAPLQMVEAEASTSVNSVMEVGASAPTTPTTPQRHGSTARLDRALVEAASEGHISDVNELLDSGANVNAVVLGDGSPLIVAAREGHIDIVRLLLDRGADVNLPVPGDGAPLIMAAREGYLSIVQLLLDRGATVDLIVPSDENALIQASAEGHLDIVKLLVARGASVHTRLWVEQLYDRPGGEWRSPLSVALREGHRQVADFLISAGAVE